MQRGPGGRELELGLNEVALRRGDGRLRVGDLDLTTEALRVTCLGQLELSLRGGDSFRRCLRRREVGVDLLACRVELARQFEQEGVALGEC